MVASRRRSFLQYLADNNPFYLLSAASMLLACVLLSNTTTWHPIAAGRLVGLIGTLSVYELLLVGLGLFLIARRGRARDGVMLLVLEAFFLADVGFLASEAYQESPATGLVVGGALLALGTLKLGAIFRTLRMPLASPAFGLMLTTLAVLLGHPAVLKSLATHDRGHVPELGLYAAWWTLGGLIAAYGLLLRSGGPVALAGTRPGVRRAGVGHVFAGVLLASVVAHLATAHWVYNCPFRAADLSPALAGLAVLVVRLPQTGFLPGRDAAVLGVLMAVTATLISFDAVPALDVNAGPLTLSPLMLTGAAAYLVLLDVLLRRYLVPGVAVGTAAALAYALSPTWETLTHWTRSAVDAVLAVVSAAMPQTQAAWGVVALAGAFVLLAVGAALSLLARPGGNGAGGVPPVTPGDGGAAAPTS